MDFLPFGREMGFFDQLKGKFVNVTIDDLGPCKKLLRVEIETEAVDKEFDSMVAEFRKFANVPGFRAGKAPRQVIEKNYVEKISAEVKKKLIPDAYHKAVKEHHLKVVGYPDIEETQFGKGEPMLFTATVETEPEFELPEYKGIAVTAVKPDVADEEVDAAIEELRQRKSELKEVDRECAFDLVAPRLCIGTPCDGGESRSDVHAHVRVDPHGRREGDRHQEIPHSGIVGLLDGACEEAGGNAQR